MHDRAVLGFRIAPPRSLVAYILEQPFRGDFFSQTLRSGELIDFPSH